VSQENVEIVREVLTLRQRMGTGEPQPRLLELFAPDMTLDMSRRTFNPDIYEGHEGALRLRRDIEDVWEEWSETPEQIIDAGERVVVIQTVRGRGRGSGVEVMQRGAFIYTVREAKVIHVELYPDPQEALRAVGLED
jgi:ketosteroid isomerase-like protein